MELNDNGDETNKPIFIYNSLNHENNVNEIEFILSTMFPLETNGHIVHKVVMNYPMISVNDCGLFALAYVESICNNWEPSLMIYNQHIMHSVYTDFIDSDYKYFADLIITNYSYTGLFPRIATAFLLKLGTIKVTLKKKNVYNIHSINNQLTFT